MAKTSKLLLLFSILLSRAFAQDGDSLEDEIRPFLPLPTKATCTTLPVTISCGSSFTPLPLSLSLFKPSLHPTSSMPPFRPSLVKLLSSLTFPSSKPLPERLHPEMVHRPHLRLLLLFLLHLITRPAYPPKLSPRQPRHSLHPRPPSSPRSSIYFVRLFMLRRASTFHYEMFFRNQ